MEQLYIWVDFDENDKSTFPPKKEAYHVRWLEDGMPVSGSCCIFDWFDDKRFDVSDDDDIDPKNPRGAQPHQWLEPVQEINQEELWVDFEEALTMELHKARPDFTEFIKNVSSKYLLIKR